MYLANPLRTRRIIYAKALKNGYSSTPTPIPIASSLTSILIANRGEIALRVGRTALQYGLRTTTIYTEPDSTSQHAASSSYAINLGDASAYLNGDKIIQVAKQYGCDGIHPGYGFLSENSAFAKKCAESGLIFIGPPWRAIEAMGNKSRSKDIMLAAGVPCIPGYHGANQEESHLKLEAEKIGYPVLLKAVKGGGGKGMRIVATASEFEQQLKSAKSEARNSFGDDAMLVEKYITTPRHIEVQIFADQHDNCVALGERDCSIQRRHQKILEESPAPHLPEALRQELWENARAAALAVGYEGAGTVEFILDNDTREFFFMEMNTRLQVEHPVTEMITGEDLVYWQLLVAQGGHLPLSQREIETRIAERGWAIEARIYAENPAMGFMPDSGHLIHLRTPTTSASVRVDAGFVAGDVVSSHYDPMIAKLIVRGSDRAEAIRRLATALEEYEVVGPVTNIEFLKRVCRHPSFLAGDVETGFIPKHQDELFEEEAMDAEVYAQAALATILQEALALDAIPYQSSGIGMSFQTRRLQFDLDSRSTERNTGQVVDIRQAGNDKFDVSINENRYTGVKSTWDSASQTLLSYFSHARLQSRVIVDGENLSVFHKGAQYRLRLAVPSWMERALKIEDTSNSVLAPMPCKILRVEVVEGDSVTKDQALVVIESMKMETVIRSPQDGIISRVVHKQGDLCKAGTALVEFKPSKDVDS